MTDPSSDEHAGRCWNCGYWLRGIESGRCPECGDPFDVEDVNSVNFGPEMGRISRFLIRPTGRTCVVLALIGAVCALGNSRWPVRGWDGWPRDLPYYLDVRAWPARAPVTWNDAVYTLGLAAAAVGAGWASFRAVARVAVNLWFGVPRGRRAHFGRRSLALWLLTACTAAGVMAGWPYRLGQRWVAEFRVASIKGAQPPELPGATREARVLLRSAISQGSTAKDRMWGVKAVSELRNYPDLLLDAIDAERDRDVRLWEIRLAGLIRYPPIAPFFLKLMHDDDPQIRAAAAEALGEGNFPFGQKAGDGDVTASDPPILHPRRRWSGYRDFEPVAGARDALVAMMTGGATTLEREAAARALVNWPPAPYTNQVPSYRLRLAEWGVMRVGADGGLRFLEEQLAEVPPFVHRIGDPAATLAGRLKLDPSSRNLGVGVGKPVIHLTSTVPLAVSIEIMINRGRPLVAYPKPDDLLAAPRVSELEYAEFMSQRAFNSWSNAIPTTVPATQVVPFGPAPARQSRELDSLDRPGLTLFDDARAGYPWLLPRHRTVEFRRLPAAGTGAPSRAAPGVEDIGGIGLLWQSLIVSPTKMPWMTDAPLGPDARFAWWDRLRRVDCSYVSSRGESERFLYYDGPSLTQAPVRARLAGGDLLIWLELPLPETRLEFGRPVRDPRGARDSVYIECDGAGNAGAILPPREEQPTLRHWMRLSQFPRRSTAADAERALHNALRLHGLLETEAAGLLDCWRDRFFKTPGRRLLTVASGADYEAICPITVHPTPTEMARVAIFWMELE